MKKIFIVGNWKSNKTTSEAKIWLEEIAKYTFTSSPEKEKYSIICPSFTLLPLLADGINTHKLSLIVGAQNISPFGMGAYTGEVNAVQAKEFASYVLIGHSERRRDFKETDEMLTKKVELALHAGLTPVYCIQNKDAYVPEGVTIVGYEPIWAIGTGKPETPENANEIARFVKRKYSYVQYVLYGGSVTPENVASFTSLPDINGVIPGGASLDPHIFSQLIEHA